MHILTIRVRTSSERNWPWFWIGYSFASPDATPASNSPDRLSSQLPARNDSTIVNETWRSAGGREREPESRGGAAVPPDGAEADVATPNWADATGDDSTDLSSHRVALSPPVRPPTRGSSASNPECWRRRRSPEKKAASSGAHRRLIGPRPRFSTAPRRMHTSSSD